MIIGIQKEGQWLSSELVGREVRNPQGEIIGVIEAILFGDEGPDGFVIQVGGPPGMEAKSVAIEWDGVTITEDSVLVEATGEELENAPEFVSLEEQRAEAVPPRSGARQRRVCCPSEPAAAPKATSRGAE